MKLPEATIAEIRRLRAAGMTQPAVAKRLGVAQATVHAYAGKHRGTRPAASPASPRVPSRKPSPSSTPKTPPSGQAVSSVPDVAAIDDLEELATWHAQVEKLATAAQDVGNFGAALQARRLLLDLQARRRQLTPPPPPDPDAEQRSDERARTELLARIEGLVTRNEASWQCTGTCPSCGPHTASATKFSMLAQTWIASFGSMAPDTAPTTPAAPATPAPGWDG